MGLYSLRGRPLLHQLVHIPNSGASVGGKAEPQSKEALGGTDVKFRLSPSGADGKLLQEQEQEPEPERGVGILRPCPRLSWPLLQSSPISGSRGLKMPHPAASGAGPYLEPLSRSRSPAEQ